MKKVLSALLILVLYASAIAGCGGGGTKLSGKYVVSSVEEDGVVTDLSEMKEMFDAMDMSLEDSMYLDFKDGEKFDMTVYGENRSGTYKIDGSTATLTVDGESVDAKIDGNTITIEDSGTKMVFTKN